MNIASHFLSPRTALLLNACLLLIYIPALWLLFKISEAPPLSLAAANYYGGALEYIAAATAVLTAGAFLFERAQRAASR